MYSEENIEADIYYVFSKMMELGHLEMFRQCLSKKKSDYNFNSKKQ
jgi:hypothetical protein